MRIFILPAGVPRKGWKYLNDYDQGDCDTACEACGTLHRYSVVIEHPDCTDTLTVGTICFGHLSEDYKQIESQREASKIKNPWRGFCENFNGNYYWPKKDALIFWSKDGKIRARVSDYWFPQTFATPNDALLAIHAKLAEGKVLAKLQKSAATKKGKSHAGSNSAAD